MPEDFNDSVMSVEPHEALNPNGSICDPDAIEKGLATIVAGERV